MFIIISTGWNCEDTIQKCMDSVYEQTLKNWKHYTVVDDKSEIQVSFISNKTDFSYRAMRHGKMENFLYALNRAEPHDDDIICDLDCDDYLLPDALETVYATYFENPECLLTYGSYKTLSGSPAKFTGTYKNDNFRGQLWKSSHLKTFKYKLFKQIKPSDFKGKDGRYLPVCSDLAMMFPMLEMAGLDRIKHIDKELYVYNDLSPHNDHKAQKENQMRIDKYLRAKRRYALYGNV